VLNPAGVRFGSGEIYSVLERTEFAARIDETICVGQRRPQDEDERVLLFVKMRTGHKLDRALEQAIRATIKAALSARHVPAYILEVEEIPVSGLVVRVRCERRDRLMLVFVFVFVAMGQYTINGKKIEIAVKKIISGVRVTPSATVANPGSLEEYYKYQEIERFAQPSGRSKDAKL